MGIEKNVELLTIEGLTVRLTHPDKLYFSAHTNLSKLDIVHYFLSVAPGALAGCGRRSRAASSRPAGGAARP